MSRDDEDDKGPTTAELVGALDGSEIQLGRTVNLAGAPNANPQDLVYATFKVPTAVAVRVQMQPSQAAVGVNILCTEATYGATFKRQIFLPAGPSRVLRFFGRMVSVAVFPTVAVPAGTPLVVAAQLSAHEPAAWGDMMSSWVTPVWAPNSATLNIYNGALVQASNGGWLLRAEGELVTLATGDAGPYYLQFFDSANAPTGGAVPFYCIGPLSAGTEFSFDHTVRPDLPFASGLWAGLSTTVGTFTPCATAGGLNMRCDVGVGT